MSPPANTCRRIRRRTYTHVKHASTQASAPTRGTSCGGRRVSPAVVAGCSGIDGVRNGRDDCRVPRLAARVSCRRWTPTRSQPVLLTRRGTFCPLRQVWPSVRRRAAYSIRANVNLVLIRWLWLCPIGQPIGQKISLLCVRANLFFRVYSEWRLLQEREKASDLMF